MYKWSIILVKIDINVWVRGRAEVCLGTVRRSRESTAENNSWL